MEENKQVTVRSLRDIEEEAIYNALLHFDGNKTKTAQALGIHIRTLRNKVAEYGLLAQFRIQSPKLKLSSEGQAA